MVSFCASCCEHLDEQVSARVRALRVNRAQCRKTQCSLEIHVSSVLRSSDPCAYSEFLLTQHLPQTISSSVSYHRKWHYLSLTYLGQKPGSSPLTFSPFQHLVNHPWFCLLNRVSPSCCQYHRPSNGHLLPGLLKQLQTGLPVSTLISSAFSTYSPLNTFASFHHLPS